MTAYVIAAALGVVGGFAAALAGVGGGILFVPALALVIGLSQVVAEATDRAIAPAQVVAGRPPIQIAPSAAATRELP